MSNHVPKSYIFQSLMFIHLVIIIIHHSSCAFRSLQNVISQSSFSPVPTVVGPKSAKRINHKWIHFQTFIWYFLFSQDTWSYLTIFRTEIKMAAITTHTLAQLRNQLTQ
jgi:hypothetical protein